MTTPDAPDYLFIDAILLAYRLGHVRHGESKAALLAAARAATDALTFLSALENFGVSRRSELHRFLGEFMAAPDHWRNLYPGALGIRHTGEAAEPLLSSGRVTFLVEPVLSARQQQLFYDAYWNFVRNHQPAYPERKRGLVIGSYANLPRDNASTLPRFCDYLRHLVSHPSQATRLSCEGFPVDIVCAILTRAYI